MYRAILDRPVESSHKLRRAVTRDGLAGVTGDFAARVHRVRIGSRWLILRWVEQVRRYSRARGATCDPSENVFGLSDYPDDHLDDPRDDLFSVPFLGRRRAGLGQIASPFRRPSQI